MTVLFFMVGAYQGRLRVRESRLCICIAPKPDNQYFETHKAIVCMGLRRNAVSSILRQCLARKA